MRLIHRALLATILLTTFALAPTKVSAAPDSDGDGIPDATEVAFGLNPNDFDSDDDGIGDGNEVLNTVDVDGDGLINALDPDSDNDGLWDGLESGASCSGPGTDASKHRCTEDADFGATTTDPIDADSDDGNVSDGNEDTNHNGQVDPGEADPTAGHGADDVVVPDSDGDGLADQVETALGTDPNDADSDDDGLIDGSEPNYIDNTDGDCVINPLDPDSDNDGLLDGTEAGQNCSNPATDASKGYCVADGDAGATRTSPVSADSDGGGDVDGSEDLNRNGQIDPGETDPSFGRPFDDQINPAFSGCPSAPQPSCLTAGSSAVALKKATDPAKNAFSWKLGKGVLAQAQGDFGDPVNTSPTYRVCAYDQTAGTPTLKLEMVLAGGDVCGADPLWKNVAGKGYVFKNKAGNGDGIINLQFKGGDAGKPSLKLKAKGTAVPLPMTLSGTEFFDQDTSVVVQFYGSSPRRCWTSTFDVSGTKKNDGAQFKAAAKLP